MTFYRNSEGYPDPSAGEALASITRDDRRKKKRLERMQAQEDYEHLCRQFKQMAEEKGFEFPSQIWLKDMKSGFIFKNG